MQYATDIELHVHTSVVGVADIATHEGSPHNVLHSSSNIHKEAIVQVWPDTCLVQYVARPHTCSSDWINHWLTTRLHLIMVYQDHSHVYIVKINALELNYYTHQ